MVLSEQLGGLVAVHERLRGALLVQHLRAILVAAAVTRLLRAREHVDGLLGPLVVREERPVIEQSWIDLGGCEVTDAHDVNLSRRAARRHWLGTLNLLEQLLHGVEQRVVLGGSEHFRHEPSTFS